MVRVDPPLLLQEGLGGGFISVLILAGALASPGVVSAKAIVKAYPGGGVSGFRAGVEEVASKSRQLGAYNEAQVINIVARTLFSEARGLPREEKVAVMSVIWNRAGEDPTKFCSVVFKRAQFSWWRKFKPSTSSGPFSPARYVITCPEELFTASGVLIKAEARAWEECVAIATAACAGNFKSNIGRRNLMGSRRDSKAAKDGWGGLCDLQFGYHCFGYDPALDPKRGEEREASVYVIKAGDTLGKIAKKAGVSVKALLKKNKKLATAKYIFPGQELKL